MEVDLKPSIFKGLKKLKSDVYEHQKVKLLFKKNKKVKKRHFNYESCKKVKKNHRGDNDLVKIEIGHHILCHKLVHYNNG